MTNGAPITSYEKVPRVQQPVRRNGRIVYFHTQDNLFGNYPAMRQMLEGASRETILMRAYGVATKSAGGRFSKFNDLVHVIPDARVPKEGTRYHLVDPCSGRNWFMGWVIVDPRGRRTLYREWPCPRTYIQGVGFPGTWAIPSGKKMDGEMGEAQQSFGFGLGRYREEILRLEGWKPATKGDREEVRGRALTAFEKVAGVTEEIEERFMDSRYANATILSARDEPLTLIEEMEELDMDFLETALIKNTIDEGIELVNDLFDYDQDKPVDATNEPQLFIAENCENIIYALHEWTGRDGQKGATKDPVDIVRWVATMDLPYLAPNRPRQGKIKSY